MQRTRTTRDGAAARLDRSGAVRLKCAMHELRKRLLGLESDLAARRPAEQALHKLNATLEKHVAERTLALCESQERLSLAQRAGGVGVFDWDLKSGRVIWTPELEGIFGLRRGSFEGNYRGWAKHVVPEDLKRLETLFAEWMRSGRPSMEWEYRTVRPDGKTRWIASRAKLVRDEMGRPLRMIGTNLDITAQKRSEAALHQLKDELEARVARRTAELDATNAALRASEQRYRTLFQQASDTIVVFDPETLRPVEFNDEACRHLGYTRKEFAKLRVSDFEVVETAADIRRHCRQVVEKGLQIFETRHRTKSGEILDVEIRAAPIQIGDHTLIQGFWRDITQRKRAEEQLTELNANLERCVAMRTAELTEANDRLRAITDSALIGILTLDQRGLVKTANPAAAVILGYAPEEMAGYNISQFMAAPQQSPAEGFLGRHLKFENQRYLTGSHEVLGRRKDGQVRLLEVIVSNFTHDQQDYFVVMLQDITERKRLERELLEAGERERRRVGHDLHDGLGQQLHALYYMASVLAEELKRESPGQAREASRLARELEHGLEMTRSLARGLQPVTAVPEGLTAALGDLAARTRKLYQVDCRFVCGTRVLVRQHSAANHLYRIAQEAVNNALKHGKPSRIQIKLTATPERVILGIWDNGRGIRRNSERSQGMGLHIMQFRADAMRGSLAVQRHPQGGTEVVCAVCRRDLLPRTKHQL